MALLMLGLLVSAHATAEAGVATPASCDSAVALHAKFCSKHLDPWLCHSCAFESVDARVPCGRVHKGDLIACRDRRIIRLDRLWQGRQELILQGRSLFVACPENPKVWRQTDDVIFVSSEDVIGPLCHAPVRGNLRLILPAAGLGFDRRV